ncbi:MAG: hypothetical protein HOK97_04995 [Deltaproteobacteria bacterium]|nr:hypothetical protein [Deltaproteobacteria bacterium]
MGPLRYVDGHTHCEVWDPTTGEWTETEPLNHGRYDHCAVALPDGSVVVIGGATKAIEQRRPDGSWHKVAELPFNLYEHQAVSLKEHILIIGGRTKRPSEAYAPVDTQKRTWLLQLADFKRIPAGDMLKDRSSMVALLVQDDQVIVIGGSCESQSLKTTEFWSLEKMKWSRGSNLGTVWSDHTASLLPDGRVFLLKNNSSDLVSPKPGLSCGNLIMQECVHVAFA